jgi:inorganic pyrophosphatase/manganese-dependent inorganic pyrophosphatase
VIVVTAGDPFTDIDAYACAIAYAELLNSQSIEAIAVLPGKYNASISGALRSIGGKIPVQPPGGEHTYVMVDISDQEYFARFVNVEQIIALFDHHPGHVEFWTKQLGTKAIIEPVGACATLIWEEFKNANITPTAKSASLLYTAILSNTLNLQASITNDRDRNAIMELKEYANVPENWTDQYFTDVSVAVRSDIARAMANDTKVIKVRGLGSELCIAQIELWDASGLMSELIDAAEAQFSSSNSELWFLNVISISPGKNFVFTTVRSVQALLIKALGGEFVNNVMTTDRLWLRKELITELIKI